MVKNNKHNEPEDTEVWLIYKKHNKDRYTSVSSQNFNIMNKKYPVIQVQANGKPDWYSGARTLCFVYSKHQGNFILEGYRGEVMKYLKENFTHYFYYLSMWSNGKSRGYWAFWKNECIGILEPDIKKPKNRKKEYHYRLYRKNDSCDKLNIALSFKRMPKRWIPEFDEL